MTIDWRAHLDFLYAVQGVPVTLTLNDGDEFDVTAMDKRAGGEVLTDPGVMTLLPFAAVRAYEFDEDVDLATLDNAALVFADETTWMVVSHQPRPFPGSEADGEILLMLERAL
jgi:hypothetical protein